MSKGKIVLVGAGDINYTLLGLEKLGCTITMVDDIKDNQYLKLNDPEPFLITKLPDLTEPFIDSNKQYPNYRKHKQTCDKNRKARKKKKRK